MKLDTRALAPWSEVNNILTRMRSLAVMVGGETHEGAADLTIDDRGHVVIAFPVAGVKSRGKVWHERGKAK